MTHVCNMRDVWPTGHPLPSENPYSLQGPEVGSLVRLASKYREAPIVVRVVERSYVWSPGECRHQGGYRRYDWSVVEIAPGKRVVVNDTNLVALLPGDVLV